MDNKTRKTTGAVSLNALLAMLTMEITGPSCTGFASAREAELGSDPRAIDRAHRRNGPGVSVPQAQVFASRRVDRMVT